MATLQLATLQLATLQLATLQLATLQLATLQLATLHVSAYPVTLCRHNRSLLSVGSPADKADLEVGDEILEVNGKSLEDATHTEVISHIHQVGDSPR